MASNTKEIKRRIKSVTNIGQITKAMELVSAAKMRKAQGSALASRPYAQLSSEILSNLARTVDPSYNPLLSRVIPHKEDEINKVLVILISSDKGLAGAFNSNIVSKAVSLMKQEGASEFDFITIGRKGADAIRRLKHNIVADFPSKDKAILLADAQPIAKISIDDFLAGKYSKVFVVYTNFISTLVQKPNILQLLPFTQSENISESLSGDHEFLFEPDPIQVLENLVTRTIEFAVYQSLVEAAASEHSARMVAMRNANDAAEDLIGDLSLSYNQARQAGITRELSEISAAKLAMEG